MLEVARKLWFVGPVVLLVGIAAAGLLRSIGGEAAQLELAPAQLHFGRVAIGAFEERALVATNTGARPLLVEAVSAEGAFQPAPASLTLGPGESGGFSVGFHPTERGPVEATLVLASEGHEFPVSLRGTGYRSPTIEVSPLSLSFGEVALGSASRGLVTIRNSGDEDLELSVHGARLFTPVTQAGVVPPGERLALEVSFAPDRLGRLEEALWIESNDPARAGVRLHLRGSGTAVAPRAGLETSPAALDFGAVSVCEASHRWLEISNRGADELTVASVTASPPFSVTDRGFRLEPGRSFRLPVAFSPVDAGMIRSALSIHSNDPRSGLVVVNLIGEAGGEACTQKEKDALAEVETSARGGRLAFRSRAGGGTRPGERSPPDGATGEAPAQPMDGDDTAPPADASDPLAPLPPSVREGSYVGVGTYRADITPEHVTSVRLDSASGQLQLGRVQLPIVELPFDQFFDFEPSDAAGRVDELGDVDLLLPVAIIDEGGNATRVEVALTTGTAANVNSDGTLVTLAGEPLGAQGDATLVGLATLPSGGLGGAMVEIVLNVHVEP